MVDCLILKKNFKDFFFEFSCQLFEYWDVAPCELEKVVVSSLYKCTVIVKQVCLRILNNFHSIGHTVGGSVKNARGRFVLASPGRRRVGRHYILTLNGHRLCQYVNWIIFVGEVSCNALEVVLLGDHCARGQTRHPTRHLPFHASSCVKSVGKSFAFVTFFTHHFSVVSIGGVPCTIWNKYNGPMNVS